VHYALRKTMLRFLPARLVTTAVLLVLWLVFPAAAYTSTQASRRAFVTSTAAALLAPTLRTPSLDMDAFAQQELAASASASNPTLSGDAALCRYGFPSPETGAACVRAGLPTRRATSGLDAFGKVDRGDFVRCNQFYETNEQGSYVKKTVCKDPTTTGTTR
jgi:hypothetical protein